MREIVGFFSFVILILITLFLVWFGLRSYGLNQPVNKYQTEQISKLFKLDSIEWSAQSEVYTLINAKYQKSWTLIDQTPLIDKLKSIKNQNVLLFFELESPKALPELRSMINQLNLGNRIILCSRLDGILKDLRDLEPQWSFCSGEVFLTRLLAFSSLGLESLINISADVVMIHLDNIKPSSEMNVLISEAKRQNKLVLMGPVTRPLKSYQPHGWVIENNP